MRITIAIVVGNVNVFTFLKNEDYVVLGIGNIGCKGLVYYEQGNLVILNKLVKESKRGQVKTSVSDRK